MRTFEAEYIIQRLEELLVEVGIENGLSQGVLYPLINELVSLRLSYKGVYHQVEHIENHGSIESIESIELVIQALSLIRTVLVLPMVMLDAMSRGLPLLNAGDEPPIIYENSDEQFEPPAMLPGRVEGAQSISEAFDRLVESVLLQIRSLQFREANLAESMIKSYFSGES